MPSEPPFLQDEFRVIRAGRARRLDRMLASERFHVSCERCNRAFTYGRADLRNYMQDVPISFFEETMPPICWGFSEKPPADCQRKVVWLNASDEDVGCSDEG